MVRHRLSVSLRIQVLSILGLFTLHLMHLISTVQGKAHDTSDDLVSKAAGDPVAKLGIEGGEEEVVQDLKSDLKNLLSDFDAMLKADEANDEFDRILLDQVDDMLAEENDDAAFLDQLNAHVENTRRLHSMAGIIEEDGQTGDVESSDLLRQLDSLINDDEL